MKFPGVSSLTVLVLVGLAACSPPDAPRFVTDVLPTGPGEALLWTRGNDEPESDRFWLERIDAGHEPRWSVALPFDRSTVLGFSGLAVADAQVVVLGRGPEGTVGRALDRASGAQQWSVTLPAIAGPEGRSRPAVVLDGPRVLFLRELAGSPRTTRIDAVALADGALLWTHQAGPLADLRRLAPDRLLVATSEATLVLDGATGQVLQTLAAATVMCPLADGVLLDSGGEAVLMSSAPARTLPAVDRLVVSGETWCGSRDSDLVVAMHAAGAAFDATAVRLAADTGAVRWQTPLGKRSLVPMIVVDGRLPRFLPIYMRGGPGDDTRELAVLDLDSGAVVQRGPITDSAKVFASAERAFVWIEARGNLIAIDPTTGAYAGATGFGPGSVADDDVRFGELWLSATTLAMPAKLPWASFDLATGKLLRHNGPLRPGDASSEHRHLFEQ